MYDALTNQGPLEHHLANRVCQYSKVDDDIYLFPAIFSTFPTDTSYHKDLMGLYYYEKDSSDKYLYIKRIMNWDDLQGTYTYSSIFSLVKKSCKSYGIVDDDITIGFSTCRAPYEKYYKEYPPANFDMSVYPFTDFYPDTNLQKYKYPIVKDSDFKIVPDIEKYQEETEDCDLRLSFLTIDDITHSGWSALANISHQGCGLNILSYYGIIPQNKARERTSCLNIQGMSIFQMVDFYSKYLKEKYNINSKFKIIRCGIEKAQEIIYSSIAKIRTNNICIILKLYRENMHGSSYSDKGHFVSFYVYGGIIYYIDPQRSIIFNPTDNNFDFFYEDKTKFKFCDLITVCSDDLPDLKIDMVDATIRERPANIYWGGNKIPNVKWFNNYNIKKLIKWFEDNQKNIKNIITKFSKKLPKEFIQKSSIKNYKTLTNHNNISKKSKKKLNKNKTKTILSSHKNKSRKKYFNIFPIKIINKTKKMITSAY
jgi:hypothetical protein